MKLKTSKTYTKCPKNKKLKEWRTNKKITNDKLVLNDEIKNK